MFINFERYDKLINDLKINDIKNEINTIFHFDFYLKVMHESEIDITKCYNNRLDYKDLDVSVENISIIYEGLYGFYISFDLDMIYKKETYTYNAREKHMEMFLFNTINNGAIIY